MSNQTQEIKEGFVRIEELSGQKSQYKNLDGLVDELIDKLNDLIKDSDDQKGPAQKAIDGLMAIKEGELLELKQTESESRGKGATVAKDRAYTRQLDSVIASIRSEISAFL